MVMGSVLVQPQRVRRGRHADPGISLFTDLFSVITRLLTDAKLGGRLGDIAGEALVANFQRIATERVARIAQAGPHAVQRLLDLLRAITGVSATVRIAAPADALELARQLLDHFADGVEGVTAVRLRPHVAAFLDILETDLGFSLVQAEAELWRIVHDIIDRLEAEPPEPNVRARENRLEVICLLRRILRVLSGFTMPRINADGLASLMASLLAGLRAPAFAARLRCVARALESAARTGQSVTELVAIGSFAEFRSLGAAAAAAEQQERFCWYATWVLGKNTVISKDRSEIRFGGKVVMTGENLGLADIPEFRDTNTVDGKPFFYTYARVDLEALDTIAFVSAVAADALIVLFHTISMEEGDFIANLVNMQFAMLAGIYKAAAARPMLPLWAENWLIPMGITIPASLEGIHTHAAPAQGAILWLTLFGPDFGEERLYRGYGLTARNALLSILTLANHRNAPNGVPENHKVAAGLNDLLGFVVSMLYSLKVPRDEWGLVNTQVTPRDFNAGLVFGWVLGFASLGWLTGRVVGGLLAWAITREVAPWAWFGRRWWSLFEHWLWYASFLYWWIEGDTDGGHYNSAGGPAYAGYPPKENSPYTLPYVAGNSCYVGQGNMGLFSHNKLNGDQTYAIDFALDQDEKILAARAGTVVDWFDWVTDDENIRTAWPDAAAADNPTGVQPVVLPDGTSQTTSSVKNFILVRHDRDEDGNLLPVGTFNDTHDRGAGNTPTRTYTAYLHGRKGSIREAFAARGITPVNIMGQVLLRGHWIMRTGATGKAPHNHLHFAARPGPDNAEFVVPYSSMGDELPVVFRDVSNFLGTDGVPTKLNWYTSSTAERS